MKTALYARVSTDEEAEANNIESQVAALRNHARAKDYEVILEFQHDGVSGATYLKDRPGGKVLLEERPWVGNRALPYQMLPVRVT